MSQDIFTQNPNLKEVFKTSDGEYFYNENSAKNHAKTLDDKSVEHLEKPKATQTAEKLTAKQQLQKDYEDKFGEVPAGSFTKAQLEDAIAKDEPLVAELKND